MSSRKWARRGKNVLIRLKKLGTRVYFPKWCLLSDYKFKNQILNIVGSILRLKQVFAECSHSSQMLEMTWGSQTAWSLVITLPPWHSIWHRWHGIIKILWGSARVGPWEVRLPKQKRRHWVRRPRLSRARPGAPGSATHCSEAPLPHPYSQVLGLRIP